VKILENLLSMQLKLSFLCLYPMVNPRDRANASRNKTDEILTVNLLILLGFIH